MTFISGPRKVTVPRNIYMVVPEITIIRSTGGLAGAAEGLSKALARAGHNVHVVIPSTVDCGIKQFLRKLGEGKPLKFTHPIFDFPVSFGSYPVNVVTVMPVEFPPRTRKGSPGITYHLLSDYRSYSGFASPYDEYPSEMREPVLLERPNIYGEKDDAERFLFFSQVVANYLRQIVAAKEPDRLPPPDIVHGHDWTTGYLGYFLQGNRIPSVYSVHNLGYTKPLAIDRFAELTGERDKEVLGTCGKGLEFHGNIDPHNAAFLHANRIVAVSPTYADEILEGRTPPPGNLYAGVLQGVRQKVRGFLNGIPAEYNADDLTKNGTLPQSFTADDLSGKIAARKLMQEMLGLTFDTNSFIVAVTGRWADQKGTSKILEVLPHFLANGDFQFVTIGSEAPGSSFKNSFEELKRRFPGRVAVVGFFEERGGYRGERLEALILAGSSALLMPSGYEPCGLGQMMAQKLGAVPLVNKTGGLADTVEPGQTGFVIDSVSTEKIKMIVEEARRLFFENPQKWRDMIGACMQKDYSWDNAAKRYLDLYEELIAEKK